MYFLPVCGAVNLAEQKRKKFTDVEDADSTWTKSLVCEVMNVMQEETWGSWSGLKGCRGLWRTSRIVYNRVLDVLERNCCVLQWFHIMSEVFPGVRASPAKRRRTCVECEQMFHSNRWRWENHQKTKNLISNWTKLNPEYTLKHKISIRFTFEKIVKHKHAVQIL